MISLVKRNIKVFFRDRTSVFFSLLSVIIVILLYALFLGKSLKSSVQNISHVDFLMDSWVMAGMITVTSVTSTLGAFGVMVMDNNRKISKDFYSSPLKRG
ncbi:MAG: ABC transporter permease, partial [Oscillospiraceae bacterium]|nr:ABC transporter permease [Oscillospiraceae bacterium]